MYTLQVSPKIHTDLLWDLTLLFVVLCGLYFAVIFFFRRKLSLGSKAVRRRKKELSPMISEFLFYDENAPKEEKTNYVNLKIEIRELLNNSANRKVLIDVLMDLRKDLSGKTLTKLFELYEGLGLHHDSYEKLESWRWQRISKGILELTQMNVEESYVFITRFINDKRSTIRKQAEIAIITLKHEGLNFFMDTTTYRISEWQQLKIMEVLKNKKNYQPPAFKQWLISKNKDVVLFALRLMKYYNQSDGNQALIELLKHKNGEIKVAAIVCIKEFHVVEAVETLKLVFWNSSVDIKIALLDAIASLGGDEDIEFLKSVGATESNFNVKSKALGSINAIAPMSVMPTVGIQKVQSFKAPKDLKTEILPEYEDEGAIPQELESETLTDTSKDIEETVEESESRQINQTQQIDAEVAKGVNEENLDPEEPMSDDISEENEKSSELSTEMDSELGNEVSEKKKHYTFKVDFLPLVTPKPEIEKITKYNPTDRQINSVVDFKDLTVTFEELQVASHREEDHKKPGISAEYKDEIDFSIEDASLDFLPIVVHSEEIITEKEVNLLNMEVFYSTIESNKPKENKILSELNALVPLPRFPKIITKDGNNVNQESKEPSSTKNIDMKQIRKIEYEGVEIKAEDLTPSKEEGPMVDLETSEQFQDSTREEGQSTLEWILAENEAHDELKLKIKTIVDEQDEITFNIPKPIFYDKKEATKVALLDDIEALGDRREVPLLREMLLEEEELSLRERIQCLIEKISETSVLKREPAPVNEEVFSVFEEFFKRVDIPSKLILLDEIVAVGDEKEIPFLKRLAESSTKKVRKKASICLERLTARLVSEKEVLESDSDEKTFEAEHHDIEMAPTPPENKIERPFSVFDIDFDLTPEGQEETEPKTNS